MAREHTTSGRVDLLVVAQMVEPGSRVLDVGCGDGELLKILTETKNVDGRGIEISREGVNFCVAKGLAVIQGDADTDLVDYPDDAFDYVILSQTLQATWQPRVGAGTHAAHRRARDRLLPEFRALENPVDAAGLRPHAAHRQSAGDLVQYRRTFTSARSAIFAISVDEVGVKIETAVALDVWGRKLRTQLPVVGLEFVRRAGCVSLEPSPLTLVCSYRCGRPCPLDECGVAVAEPACGISRRVLFHQIVIAM